MQFTPRTFRNSPAEASAIANGSSPMPAANLTSPSTNPSPNEKSLSFLKYPRRSWSIGIWIEKSFTGLELSINRSNKKTINDIDQL
ncbi:MAG: hypothetical protein WBO76_17685 [Saprospiraceae bacterium]